MRYQCRHNFSLHWGSMPLAACSVLQVTCTASASHLSHAVCMLSPDCLLAMHLPISNSPQTNQANVRPWPTSTKLLPSLMYLAVWMVHKFQFYHQQSMKTSMSAEKDSIHSMFKPYVMHKCVSSISLQSIQAVHTTPLSGATVHCAVYQYLEQHTAEHQRWLLGDSGYPLSPFLMTPIANPTRQAETNYNKRHMQTRNTVERSFGLLKMRFRCLHNTGGCLQSPPERCAQIITACAVLHNMCINNAVPVPDELSQSHISGDDDQPVAPSNNNNNNSGAAVRRQLIDRFSQ